MWIEGEVWLLIDVKPTPVWTWPTEKVKIVFFIQSNSTSNVKKKSKNDEVVYFLPLYKSTNKKTQNHKLKHSFKVSSFSNSLFPSLFNRKSDPFGYPEAKYFTRDAECKECYDQRWEFVSQDFWPSDPKEGSGEDGHSGDSGSFCFFYVLSPSCW